MNGRKIAFGVVSIGLVGLGVVLAADRAPRPKPGEVAVTFEGGHGTDRRDGGRPVGLVAAALGVPPDVFREAFTHVHPADPGRGPTGDEARANKHELLGRLETYGVTNERLDEVSNFYRYRPQANELWTHRDAVAFATVKDGRVVGFRVADPGYGYSTPPVVRVAGVPDAGGIVTLHADTDLKKNGSVGHVAVGPPATTPSDTPDDRPPPPVGGPPGPPPQP